MTLTHRIHKERCTSCSTNIGYPSVAPNVISGGENIPNVGGLTLMVPVTIPIYFDVIRKIKQLWPKNLDFDQFYK